VKRARFPLVTLFAGLCSWCSPATASAAEEVQTPASTPEAPAASTPGTPAARERLSFAVVIGNNKSLGRRRPELRYADDDAARYFEILQTMAPGRVSLLADFDRDTERLFPTTRPQATAPGLRNLEVAGKRLAEQVRTARAAGHETEVYFIFAGHGDVAEGEGFIELSDARFRSRDLEAWLRAIPFTRAHVILDSCNSFFMLGVRKPGGRHFATSEDAARALAARLPNVGVFLSTSADGEAFEWSEIQSGIFSHVVRSGLLGGADANADGAVSYLELAGFVETATADVQNPSMRPHVFARGPSALDHTPIARLHSMSEVRRFDLEATGPLRVRLKDSSGLPLLDAHTEHARPLRIALPQSWSRGAVLEREEPATRGATGPAERRFYAVPEEPAKVTLAALVDVGPPDARRGPGETFQTLFARPFGPQALARYAHERLSRPAPVYGVSQQDTERMQLVLGEIERSERGRRLSEGIGGIGFGMLLGGAGVGVLSFDSDLSRSEKKEARVLGGVLLGLSGLFLLGGTGALFIQTTGEEAASEFRRLVKDGGDPARAFAAADERLRELAKKRRAERYAGLFFGGLIALGSGTGLVISELTADQGGSRLAPRLGWSAGILAGGMMIGDALLLQTPIDSLTKIWRDDPSLNQYQPTLSISRDGAVFGFQGAL
jgi:hypothetical protein